MLEGRPKDLLIDNLKVKYKNFSQEPDIKATFEKLREGHGCVVKTGEVAGMVQGKDRRPELALKLALECRFFSL